MADDQEPGIFADEVRRIAKQQENEQLQDLADAMNATLAPLFDKQKAYFNIVTLGGYAGMFTLWNFTKDFQPPRIILWVGLLISISLLLFVLHLVFQMTVQYLMIRTYVRVCKPAPTVDAQTKFLQGLERINTVAPAFLHVVWLAAFPFILVTALGGGVLLLVNFIVHIWSGNYTPAPATCDLCFT